MTVKIALKSVFLVAIFVVGILLITIVCLLQKSANEINKLESKYQQVATGMTREEVENIMGLGGVWSAEDPNKRIFWDDMAVAKFDKKIEGFSLRYSTNTYFLPVTLEFVFDAEGLIVGRHRYD